MTVVLGSISPISIDMDAAAVLLAREGGLSFVNLRVIPGEEEAVLASLRQIWKGYGLMRPFEGVTFTQHIEDEGTVRGLQDTRAIMRVIALLAVMIACLGLLGIAGYAAEARIKEMGIRKSIGATAQSLVVLLSREQAMLVAISVVIGPPGGGILQRLVDGYVSEPGRVDGGCRGRPGDSSARPGAGYSGYTIGSCGADESGGESEDTSSGGANDRQGSTSCPAPRSDALVPRATPDSCSSSSRSRSA